MHFSELGSATNAKDCDSPERSHWRIWCMLTIVSVSNVAVLITAQMLLYSGLITDWWPWQQTHVSLMAVLAVANVGFILYLTVQKKQIMHMQKQLKIIEAEKNEKISRNAARLYALTSVSRKMCSETEPKKIFKYITDTCIEIFDCSRASLMLLDAETGELVVRAVSPLGEDSFSGVRQKVGKGIAGHVAETREALLLRRDTDMSRITGIEADLDNSVSAMIVPIILRDELVGVVNVSSRNDEVEYDDEDTSALQVFADNAGAFIRHSEQAEWMRKTIERLRKSPREKTSVSAPS